MKKCIAAAFILQAFLTPISWGQVSLRQDVDEFPSSATAADKQESPKLHFYVCEDKDPPPESWNKPLSNKTVLVEAKVVAVIVSELSKSDRDSLQRQFKPARQIEPENKAAAHSYTPSLSAQQTASADKPPSDVCDGYKMAVILDRLEQDPSDQSIKILSSPRLWILDGCTARIAYGPQVINVPQRQKDGSIKLVKRHGPKMTVTPAVFGDSIHLHLKVQYLGNGAGPKATDLNGLPIGNIHECDANLNLKNAKPFAVGDSQDTEVETTWVGVPFLSNVPVVGAMFRHVEETRRDVASFVVVRATIVKEGTPPLASLKKTQLINPKTLSAK